MKKFEYKTIIFSIHPSAAIINDEIVAIELRGGKARKTTEFEGDVLPVYHVTSLADGLNKYGQEGWEVYQVENPIDSIDYYIAARMKREVEGKAE